MIEGMICSEGVRMLVKICSSLCNGRDESFAFFGFNREGAYKQASEINALGGVRAVVEASTNFKGLRDERTDYSVRVFPLASYETLGFVSSRSSLSTFLGGLV